MAGATESTMKMQCGLLDDGWLFGGVGGFVDLKLSVHLFIVVLLLFDGDDCIVVVDESFCACL